MNKLIPALSLSTVTAMILIYAISFLLGMKEVALLLTFLYAVPYFLLFVVVYNIANHLSILNSSQGYVVLGVVLPASCFSLMYFLSPSVSGYLEGVFYFSIVGGIGCFVLFQVMNGLNND